MLTRTNEINHSTPEKEKSGKCEVSADASDQPMTTDMGKSKDGAAKKAKMSPRGDKKGRKDPTGENMNTISSELVNGTRRDVEREIDKLFEVLLGYENPTICMAAAWYYVNHEKDKEEKGFPESSRWQVRILPESAPTVHQYRQGHNGRWGRRSQQAPHQQSEHWDLPQ